MLVNSNKNLINRDYTHVNHIITQLSLCCCSLIKTNITNGLYIRVRKMANYNDVTVGDLK